MLQMDRKAAAGQTNKNRRAEVKHLASTKKSPGKPHAFWKQLCLGLGAGFLNGLFGAGGGMICVPALKWLGFTQKQAHATSIGVIWPLTLASLVLSLVFRKPDLSQVPLMPLVVCALIGSTLGGVALQKIKPKWLNRLFGGLLSLSALWILCQW